MRSCTEYTVKVVSFKIPVGFNLQWNDYIRKSCLRALGWSGGAMVLSKLPVPGRPTNLDYSRARAYCACSRCGRGCLDIFSLIYLFSFLSPSLWETTRYRLKYCLKGPLNPKQPTNQSKGVTRRLF